ncbi:MAG: MBL fold metallo-hydrolase [Synergistaceae bacterium]|nr:MBL fold metallo-hydrolase [Synergistaceae bacterium]
MKIHMFGTGNALSLKYYNTCFMMEEEGFRLMVDGGGGNQILRKLEGYGVPAEEVHHLFVTHKHMDHLLGVFWMLRVAGQKMEKDEYEGSFNVYCHGDLADTLMTMSEMTLNKKELKYFGGRILFHRVEDGGEYTIDKRPIKFFDIGSTKAKQFGFSLSTNQGLKVTCLGDEPYNEERERPYLDKCGLLMHEAFCLHSQADRFKPYEKSHSTVKDACELAESLNIPNLILYHSEDKSFPRRKELYSAEGRQYYSGNLFIPDDDETLEF